LAHRGDDQHAVYGATVKSDRTAALLLLGVMLFYGWSWLPVEHASQAWNVMGSVSRIALLVALLWNVRSRFALMVGAWWFAEEAMVSACSVAYMLSPWEVAQGQAQCSALLQFDLGRIGVLALVLIVSQYVKTADK
jgi:hypothetical protein